MNFFSACFIHLFSLKLIPRFASPSQRSGIHRRLHQLDINCTLAVNPAIINHGDKSPEPLQVVRNHAALPSIRILMFGVLCPCTQTMRLVLRDEKGSDTDADVQNDKKNRLHIRVLEAQLDGQNVQIASITPDGVISCAPANSLALQLGNQFSPIKNGKLATGKVFSVRIEIDPVLIESSTHVSSYQISPHLKLELLN